MKGLYSWYQEEFEYVRAGHNIPIYYSRERDATFNLKANGFAAEFPLLNLWTLRPSIYCTNSYISSLASEELAVVHCILNEYPKYWYH